MLFRDTFTYSWSQSVEVDPIGHLLDTFTPIERANDVTACGYDPDR